MEDFLEEKKMFSQTSNLPLLHGFSCFPNYGFDRVHQQMAFFHYIHFCWTMVLEFQETSPNKVN
jgi:hypothetical protein